jgi:protein PhnA
MSIGRAARRQAQPRGAISASGLRCRSIRRGACVRRRVSAILTSPEVIGRRLRPGKKIMSTIPACPQCAMDNTYPDGENYVCPDCAHEWPVNAPASADDAGERVVKDANGNPLADGDAVVLIKDLKVKGSSITLKMGTKVKSIRLVGGDHEVDCKMDAGNFMLKAAYLKKV